MKVSSDFRLFIFVYYFLALILSFYFSDENGNRNSVRLRIKFSAEAREASFGRDLHGEAETWQAIKK